VKKDFAQGAFVRRPTETTLTFEEHRYTPEHEGGAVFAIKTLVGNVCLLAACSAFASMAACGGRSTDNGTAGINDDGTGGTGGSSGTTPAPTCADICRRVVDQCIPGGSIEECSADCEAMRTRYQGCEALDTFLRCMPKVPVLCAGEKVTIDGCYDERNQLS